VARYLGIVAKTADSTAQMAGAQVYVSRVAPIEVIDWVDAVRMPYSWSVFSKRCEREQDCIPSVVMLQLLFLNMQGGVQDDTVIECFESTQFRCQF
jgi:hypothetical protein